MPIFTNNSLLKWAFEMRKGVKQIILKSIKKRYKYPAAEL